MHIPTAELHAATKMASAATQAIPLTYVNS